MLCGGFGREPHSTREITENARILGVNRRPAADENHARQAASRPDSGADIDRWVTIAMIVTS
jgi:hypothetical protein